MSNIITSTNSELDRSAADPRGIQGDASPRTSVNVAGWQVIFA